MPRLQKSSGNGHQLRKSGIDGMLVNGITGDPPRLVSPTLAGPGGKDTGIMVDTSSSTYTATGIDSKVVSGSDMDQKFQSAQRSQEVNQSADLSTD